MSGRVFIFLLSPIVIALFGLMQSNPTYAVNSPSLLIPDGLGVSGDLTQAPVTPLLYWNEVEGATWYAVYLQKDSGQQIFYEWWPSTEAECGTEEGICYVGRSATVDDLYESWGLLTDEYEWWAAAYIEATGEILWSGGETYAPAVFSVEVPPPNPPALLATWLLLEPYIQIYMDTNTSWFQLYVGGHGEQYLEWHSVNDPACEIGELQITCIFVQETHLPLYWGSGTYAVWMQGWGPGGFSSPDGTNSIESWGEDVYDSDPGLVFPDESPNAPENLEATSDMNSINIAWDYSQNGSWYHMVIEGNTGSIVYDEWYHSSDLTCEEARCSHTIASLPFGNYTIAIQAWGPGGFSTGGPNGDGYGVLNYAHGAFIEGICDSVDLSYEGGPWANEAEVCFYGDYVTFDGGNYGLPDGELDAREDFAFNMNTGMYDDDTIYDACPAPSVFIGWVESSIVYPLRQFYVESGFVLDTDIIADGPYTGENEQTAICFTEL